MKRNDFFPSPCSCRPERPVSSSPVPAPGESGPFLMQRILACGRVHRRRQCTPLCLNELPPEARPPFLVTDVHVCACPQWTENPCPEREGMALRVTVPLQVRVRDGLGRMYVIPSSLTEDFLLRYECPRPQCWRGQIFVQAAVRLACRPRPCGEERCDVPLEVLIEGYALSPCTLGCANHPACPDPRPLYPRPLFDPYNGN